MEKKRRVDDDDELVSGSNFDKLPDEIVMSILDCLNWKDAAVTSAVSHRFHRAWKNVIKCKKHLDFNVGTYHYHDKFSRFVEFVNHNLRTHEGSKVDYLRIAFPKDYIGNYDIIKSEDCFENWVRFARDKCVQTLKIHMPASFQVGAGGPVQLLTIFRGSLDKLTSLSLKQVCLNGENLELVLKSHLVNLKSLVLKHVRLGPIFNYNVVRLSSSTLKHLEMKCCDFTHSIDIDTMPNLEHFEWHGHNTRVHFKHVPKLSKVDLQNPLCHDNLLELLQEAGTLLQSLRLNMVTVRCKNPWHVECTRDSPRFPQLPNLKKLEIIFGDSRILPWITSVIVAACPKLRELTLINKDCDCDGAWSDLNRDELHDARSVQMHPCLKKVEFRGWLDDEDEVEAYDHLKEIAPNLESITTRYI